MSHLPRNSHGSIPQDVSQLERDQLTFSRPQPDEFRADPSHFIVGIGASAGGLEALERFFQNVPQDSGLAFVVVQHLSPDFKSLMREVLSRWTAMPIVSVQDQMTVVPNTVFLMPPKTEMIISNNKLLLTPREKTEELRLPIDQFFRSLARDAGECCIGIVLSGTGSDGSRGIREIHAAKGLVLVQSPETAKFDGMPKSAIETNIVSAILPPEEMPSMLLRHVRRSKSDPGSDIEQTGMTPIFQLLRESFGIDFSYYKPSTVTRRTEHRLQLGKIDNLEDYLDLVRNDRNELDALYRDLLIGVTNFFRDPAAFAVLEDQIIPELIENLNPRQEFRAWVAGCATGEEAYSIAILLDEALQKIDKKISVKIFATDVHPKSLEIAAAGVYSTESVQALSAERLKKYFNPTREGYRVTADLRNMVVFAHHNITKDAPFTRMDLISCRNLLIYLLPAAQNKALSLFHFGLRTGGVLFLGPSENPGDLSGEFQPIHSQWRLFRKRRDVRLPADLRFPLSAGVAYHSQSPAQFSADAQQADIFLQALEATLDSAILIDADRKIIRTFGDAVSFLRMRSGPPSLDLLEMLSDELKLAVGAALHRAAKDKSAITLNNVRLTVDRQEKLINLTATPLPATRKAGAHWLIHFAEAMVTEVGSYSKATDLNLSEAAQDHMQGLEAELRFTKENLQATIEELETSNEELQATNEELLASNEELQSTNEELHSVNEELYTVNAEYQKKIEELTELTHDMNNLLASTDVHTIFLDEKLCIRRFTPKMGQLFNLIDSDLGRNIHSFMHSIECEDLPQKLSDVLERRTQYEQEVQNKEGEAFLMRILPYKGDPDQSGVVLTLIDITGLKVAETRFTNAMEVSPNGMLMVCSRGLITQANNELARIFGYEVNELIGQPLELLIDDQHSREHVSYRQQYFRAPYILRRMGSLPYVWGKHKKGDLIPVDVHVRPISTPHGRQAIASVVDVSRHQQLEESLRLQVQQRDRFLATLSHELRNPMSAILSSISLLDQLTDADDQVRQPCDIIRRKASQIALLLNDLLDVARVTQGKITLRLEVLDLCAICRESIEAVRPLINKRQHRFDLQLPTDPVWIEADRVRIFQILENLLTNAVKYTDRGGEISMRLAVDKNQVEVFIKDNGRGMTKEFIQSIFDMFVQSEQTLDRSEGGMGVGLTLVRSLVEMHQGTIKAHSDGTGLGSTFAVTFPVTEKRQDSTKPSSQGVTQTGTRIVYIEDDEDTRSVTTALLKRFGHQVLGVAENGEDGFELIRQLHPAAVVLDIGLPKMDGYQLAKKIRNEIGEEVYLIALTGYGRGEDHKTVVEAGFNCHLVKPILIQELDKILREIPE